MIDRAEIHGFSHGEKRNSSEIYAAADVVTLSPEQFAQLIADAQKRTDTFGREFRVAGNGWAHKTNLDNEDMKLLIREKVANIPDDIAVKWQR